MTDVSSQHYVFILMGVSGSGKSVVANHVSQKLQTAFLDGDFLHPRSNILKMAEGHPLNDEDRAPWLQAINDAAFAMQRTQKVSIIVCSALKQSYRDILRKGNKNLKFIYLKGDFDTIEKRLKARKGHFFKTNMLVTQFATLEEPTDAETDVLTVDINKPLDDVIAQTVTKIESQIQ